MIVVAAAGVFLSDVQDRAVALPASADLVQRHRVARATLLDALANAGCGFSSGPLRGPLARVIPAVYPHRRGVSVMDAELSAFDDRLTVLAVDDTAGQALLAADMPAASAPLALAPGPGCRTGSPACGLQVGQPTVIVDRSASGDVFRPTAVTGNVLSHGALSRPYTLSAEPTVAPLRLQAFWFDAAGEVLRQYIGASAGMPLVDHVVSFRVRYFGDPLPPLAPVPPPGESNCVIDETGWPRLPILSADHGPLTELTLSMLSDGPACGLPPSRFDADLLRIRMIRISLRLEAAEARFRGTDLLWFARPGTGHRAATLVRDFEAGFDVSPPNLQDLAVSRPGWRTARPDSLCSSRWC